MVARKLPPVQGAVLRALATDFGSYIPTWRLAQIVWANDPSGGPDGYTVALSQAIRRMRPVLNDNGLTAEAQAWRGYRVRAA